MHFLDDYVFRVFDVPREKVAVIAKDVYDIGEQKHIFEACSFSLYWALKYDVEIEGHIVEDSIKSGDCIFLMLSYLYAKKQGSRDDLKKMKKHGESLLPEFDRYWLFVYEVLPRTKLSGDFACLKKAGVSFIKEEEG